MVTAYDYPFGLLADQAEVDMVLVGDSLGMVVMGLSGTVEVTMEDMIHHIKAVMRGCKPQVQSYRKDKELHGCAWCKERISWSVCPKRQRDCSFYSW